MLKRAGLDGSLEVDPAGIVVVRGRSLVDVKSRIPTVVSVYQHIGIPALSAACTAYRLLVG